MTVDPNHREPRGRARDWADSRFWRLLHTAQNHLQMQIFIALLPGGRKITAEVEGTDSVEALRRQIQALASPLLGDAAGSAAPGQQLLMFNEAVLEDGKTIADYGILKESELRVSLRPVQLPIGLDVGGNCFSATLDSGSGSAPSRGAGGRAARVRGGGAAAAPRRGRRRVADRSRRAELPVRAQLPARAAAGLPQRPARGAAGIRRAPRECHFKLARCAAAA
eukprot:COSAG04_NODE_219_length_19842_cov_1164.283695_16_plen_223_part_00